MSNKAISGDRYLTFNLGEEEYALPLHAVREVIALPEITPIPQSAAHFLGIMNLRGQVISIVDLRLKFRIKPSSSTETAVIICDLNPYCIGVVVDSVNSVQTPGPEEISEKPQNDSSTADYITGIYRKEDRLILLVDLVKTLSLEEQRALAEHPGVQAT